jgi:hypothetical protein
MIVFTDITLPIEGTMMDSFSFVYIGFYFIVIGRFGFGIYAVNVVYGLDVVNL